MHVPANQGPGHANGTLAFVGDSKAAPGQNQVHPAVGLLVDVTVGGQAVVKVTWLSGRVPDVAQGSPVLVYGLARNDGNVATTAQLHAVILPFATDAPVLASGDGSASVLPGEEKEVLASVANSLGPGQYRARLSSTQQPAFNVTLPFKVTSGGAAPDGELVAFTHDAFGTPGQPMRIDALFRNTGTIRILSAAVKAEAQRDGVLLQPLTSDALAVEPGKSVNLTFYWTPPVAGRFHIVGHVLYDGYLTPDSDSIVNVRDSSSTGALGSFAWWWVVFLLIAAALIVYAVLRQREKRKGKKKSGPGAKPR
jgi:hypothetical protein